MIVIIILDSLLYKCPVVDSFLSFVFYCLWILCFSPISVQPLTLLVDCWLKSEEFPKQMAISSAQNSSDKSFFLRKLTGFVPQLCIFDHTLSCCVFSSLHLCLSCSIAQFLTSPLLSCALWSAFGLLRISSFTLSTRSLQNTTPEDILS